MKKLQYNSPVILTFFLLSLGVLVLGGVLSLPVKPWLQNHLPKWTEPLTYAGCLVLLALCMMKLAAGGFAPFIYAQF